MSTQNLSHEQVERLAASRAKAKMGWFFHAALYILVNLVLTALSLIQGRQWHWFVLLGWGLGLSFHGLAVWFKSSSIGYRLRESMIAKERAALLASENR